METGFLNFHDAEHFSDFALTLDQHDLLDDSQNSLMAIDNDFDYMQSQLDTSGGLWGTEQMLNGDMAVLPVSGVASIMPKLEDIKEDYAKVLTDWQEHIGYLQASDMEEDIDIVALNTNMSEKSKTALPAQIFQQDNQYLHTNITTPIKNPQKTVVSNENKIEKNIKINLKPRIKVITSSPINSIIETTPANIIPLIKQESQQLDEKIDEDLLDVETIPEYAPVLEAGDVKSLLEQFEASEAGVAQPIVKAEPKLTIIKPINKPIIHKTYTTNASKVTLLNKSIESQTSKHHNQIRDSLPKEVIDRIKKASSRKNKTISVIPAFSNTKKVTKITEPRPNSRNKFGKSSTTMTVPDRVDGSVQLDHDYCSSNFTNSASSDYGRQSNGSKKAGMMTKILTHNRASCSLSKTKSTLKTLDRNDLLKRTGSWADNNSKKDSGLESGDVSDSSEDPTQSNPTILTKAQPIAQTSTQSSRDTSLSINNSIINKSGPVLEMKIRSALATSILQLRNGVLTKTKSIDGNTNLKGKQMISVLKKPPLIISNNLNESIVTTINSSNDEVQNIIVQDTSSVVHETEKKPPRRKLNLAEYRTRRDAGRSDNSRTCSPIQKMDLVYYHHVCTSTDPVWAEKEIVSALKPRSEIEEEKTRPKPLSCEIAIQTYETGFNNSWTTEEPEEGEVAKLEIMAEPELMTDAIIVPAVGEIPLKERVSRVHDRKQRSYRQRRDSSNSTSQASSNSRMSHSRRRSISRRSRSRSVSRRTRSRSSRSRSRSRSLSRRRNARQRRISHRRSSVSSSSSWSSRSRSYSRSRSRTSSRSRSRSSRSSSSSRYSSCSRSSRSNLASHRRSSNRRQGRRKTNYNKIIKRRRSSKSSYRGHKNWRRSPSYRRPYDTWFNAEKKRQVEERRVIYVGRLEEGITKAELRQRFEAFGPVLDISLHFREHGDNYGFVTFSYKNDAYEAVEHGNDDPSMPRYDLCFGGRRAFCKVKYADLDGAPGSSLSGSRSFPKSNEEDSFDLLLKEAKAKLRNRKV